LQKLMLDAPNADALHLTVFVHYHPGDLSKAEVLISKALAIKPGVPEAHSHLDVVLLKLGKTEQAIAALQRVIAIRPTYSEAHNNLGLVLAARSPLTAAHSI
jgi:Flp pilus assembly protein TadD